MAKQPVGQRVSIKEFNHFLFVNKVTVVESDFFGADQYYGVKGTKEKYSKDPMFVKVIARPGYEWKKEPWLIIHMENLSPNNRHHSFIIDPEIYDIILDHKGFRFEKKVNPSDDVHSHKRYNFVTFFHKKNPTTSSVLKNHLGHIRRYMSTNEWHGHNILLPLAPEA